MLARYDSRPPHQSAQLRLFLSLLLCAVSSRALARSMGIEGHPPLPAEEKQQCLMLTEQIGIYELPGFVLKPYTNEMVFTLLKALEHPGQGVKLCTMLMLAQVIQQFEVAVTLLRETVTPKMI